MLGRYRLGGEYRSRYGRRSRGCGGEKLLSLPRGREGAPRLGGDRLREESELYDALERDESLLRRLGGGEGGVVRWWRRYRRGGDRERDGERDDEEV